MYAGTRRTARRRLRLVAVRLPDSTEYRFYLTNIEPGSLDAHALAQTYAARWQIELIFKELKSHYRLQELPTRKAHIVEILLLGAVITLLLSRRLLRAVQERLRHAGYKMPEQRWAAIFAAAPTILDIVVLPPRVSNVIARRLESMLLNEAPDPNRSRKLLLERVESGAAWARLQATQTANRSRMPRTALPRVPRRRVGVVLARLTNTCHWQAPPTKIPLVRLANRLRWRPSPIARLTNAIFSMTVRHIRGVYARQPERRSREAQYSSICNRSPPPTLGPDPHPAPEPWRHPHARSTAKQPSSIGGSSAACGRPAHGPGGRSDRRWRRRTGRSGGAAHASSRSPGAASPGCGGRGAAAREAWQRAKTPEEIRAFGRRFAGHVGTLTRREQEAVRDGIAAGDTPKHLVAALGAALADPGPAGSAALRRIAPQDWQRARSYAVRSAALAAERLKREAREDAALERTLATLGDDPPFPAWLAVEKAHQGAVSRDPETARAIRDDPNRVRWLDDATRTALVDAAAQTPELVPDHPRGRGGGLG